MAARVVDASAVAAILFGEPDAEALAARLQGHRLVTPALMPFEVASVCLKKIYRHPEMRERLLEAYAGMERAGIEEIEVRMTEVISLAEKSEITCYDAAYLWLALQLDVELVTLDGKLGAAAKELLG